MNKKEFLIISIGIFFTIAAWVLADLYIARQSIVVDDIARGVAVPSYSLSAQVIDELQSRTP